MVYTMTLMFFYIFSLCIAFSYIQVLAGYNLYKYLVFFIREETEIIEGEVVEIQIDRPASGTVSVYLQFVQIQQMVLILGSTQCSMKK